MGGLIVGGAAGYLVKGSGGSAPSAASTTTVTNTVTVTNTGSGATTTATTGPTTSTTSTTSTGTGTPTQNQAYVILNPQEAALVEAIGEALIPSDSNGPGFKEAGGLYFVDGQLAGEYGTNGNMYMDGPFVTPGTGGPIKVGSETYPGGSPSVRLGAGTRYQYPLTLRQFWKIGLAALQTYSNGAYHGDFQTLSATDQAQVLTDLYNNKPTNFTLAIPSFKSGTSVTQTIQIVPQDFFYDLYIMCWCGYLMDPVYGGNRNMVGWQYVAFNGTNMGNFYNEGLTDKQLMVATSATKLQPASLGQFQQAFGSTAASTSSSSSSGSSAQSATTSTISSAASGSASSGSATSSVSGTGSSTTGASTASTSSNSG